MNKLIYLDNAATTKLYPEILKEMEPYFSEYYGNPSSIYQFAQKSQKAIDLAREEIAAVIGAKPEEVYFTGGGSESDNWALKAIADAYENKGKHIITSKIEHHAVLHTCEYLEKKGFEITYLPVNEEGFIDLDELKKSIREDTICISIMAANNEIGTIQPIAEIGAIAREKGVFFHTDAVQAFGHIPLSVEDMKIDMLSASGHKIHGPKGIGFLYIRKGIKIVPYLHGGAQERGKRAGTHNVPGIVGMAAAARLAKETLKGRIEKETSLRDYLIERIEKEIPFAVLNGSKSHRLPNNISFCFRFIEGESMLIMLDGKGICASSGSACTSGSLDPSHVLLAIGRPHEIAHGSLRLTLSEENTKEELDVVVEELKKIIERLRGMSPLYEDFLQTQTGGNSNV
ncbi:MAG: cysteine desulfurase NifS [Lachnospiraceae bacterium]|nr:cysteine desulfurase NifS [Lachnospiraceae bacterium]